jgi:quinol monooxygenase YgiN
MHIRLVEFKLGAGKYSAARTVADRIIPAIRRQPGCERAEFFVADATGEYGLVVLWASKKAADASYAMIYPMLSSAVDNSQRQGNTHYPHP